MDGNWKFVSGTTVFGYGTMTIPSEVGEHAEQTMRNISRVLAEANASFADVICVGYTLPNAADFELYWPVFRRYSAEVQPAATMIKAGLADPRMRTEIEVRALRIHR